MKNKLKILLIMAAAAFCACEDPYMDSTLKVYDMQPISSYLQSHPDEFSEWVEILEYADLYNALNQASTAFTAFTPTNEAVQAFYTANNVQSISDLGLDYAKELVKYHVINDSISLETFMTGGILTYRTVSGDFLEVVFKEDDENEGGGQNSIYMNGEAHVKEMAISTSNGTVYVLDDVMRPKIESLSEVLAGKAGNDILNEALRRTGWADTLSIIADTTDLEGGSKYISRRFYTILGVSDDVFRANEITSADELAAHLGAGNDYTNPDNALNRYVAYHILKGNYRLSALKTFDAADATTKLVETQAGNTLIKISQEAAEVPYYINLDGGEGYQAQFIEDESDYLVKNGYIHQLDDYLPICNNLQPTAIYFDVANYPEVASYVGTYGINMMYQTALETSYFLNLYGVDLSCYTPVLGPLGTSYPGPLRYYTISASTETTKQPFADALNNDYLSISLGYSGSLTLTTPPILPGKYKVTLYYLYDESMVGLRNMTEGSSNGGRTRYTIDGTNVININMHSHQTSSGTLASGIYNAELFSSLTFTEIGTHTLEIYLDDLAASLSRNSRIMIDYILFTPI